LSSSSSSVVVGDRDMYSANHPLSDEELAAALELTLERVRAVKDALAINVQSYDRGTGQGGRPGSLEPGGGSDMLERMLLSPRLGNDAALGGGGSLGGFSGGGGGGAGAGGEDLQAAAGSASSLLRMDLDLVMAKILTPREQRTVALRFGLDDGQHRSGREVATILGVNRNTVRSICVSAFKKMSEHEGTRDLLESLDEVM
jgi:hypothetical protein